MSTTSNVTSYTIRHSFATTLKAQDVSIEMISELLAHESITTTQIYLGRQKQVERILFRFVVFICYIDVSHKKEIVLLTYIRHFMVTRDFYILPFIANYLIIVIRFFPRMIPRNTAIKPSILLASTLSSAILYSPVRISTIVSSVKEEKVVKPPKSPVNRKALVLIEKL